jgi:ketosteroid isomerase-like protein
MTDPPDTMRAYFDAWLRNDWDAAMAFWADEVVHHVAGHGPLSGDFHGKQAFLDAYGAIFERLGGTIEVVGLHDFVAGPDHAVALVTERAIRGDRSLDFNRVVVYHVRDGRIVETWSYDWDPAALDEFWS